MTTLAEYREMLSMSRSEFAREARLDYQTVSRAEEGEQINGRSARAIAQALSRLLGRTVAVRDIDGMNVRM
jgi:transcriptional regulator with XRE-family HTH domain